MSTSVMTGYSDRINHAFAFAAKHHDQQVRKGTRLPYLTHPANVAVILTRYGCNEDTVVAGILHDVVEDCVRDGWTREMLEERIGHKFGSGVLDRAHGHRAPHRRRRHRDVARRSQGRLPRAARAGERGSALGVRGRQGAQRQLDPVRPAPDVVPRDGVGTLFRRARGDGALVSARSPSACARWASRPRSWTNWRRRPTS